MSLTLLKNGTPPIARVVSPQGYYYVYLSTFPAPLEEKSSRSRIKSRLPPTTIDQITLALQHGLTIEELYSALSSVPPPSPNMREFQASTNEMVEVIPSPKPECYYIAGARGSGKTFVAAMLARNYKRLHPDSEIVLFGRQADDPAFKGIEREEIILDKAEQEKEGRDLDDLAEQIKENPLKSYSNKLVILDDTDSLEVQSKKLAQTMLALNADLMQNGRKMGISVIYISHIMMKGHQTKVPLTECQYVFFFPGTGARGIRIFLKEYAQLENPDIKKILAISNSRWIMLSRNMPRYIATEKSIFLL